MGSIKTKIIIAEDDLENRNGFKKFVQESIIDTIISGFSIVTVENLQELGQFEEEDMLFFIIDLDLGFGIQDTIDKITYLSNNYELSTIIVFSANVKDTKIRNRCLEAGADKLFSKVDTFKKLLEIVGFMAKRVKDIYDDRIELDRVKMALNSRPIILKTEDINSIVIEVQNNKVLLALNIGGEFIERWYSKDYVSPLKPINMNQNIIIRREILSDGFNIRFILSDDDLFDFESQNESLLDNLFEKE